MPLCVFTTWMTVVSLFLRFTDPFVQPGGRGPSSEPFVNDVFVRLLEAIALPSIDLVLLEYSLAIIYQLYFVVK